MKAFIIFGLAIIIWLILFSRFVYIYIYEPTICKKCDWYRTTTSIAGRNGFKFKCTSPKAPYSDYETGYKDPKKINDGKCLFYKPYKGQMPPFWREM